MDRPTDRDPGARVPARLSLDDLASMLGKLPADATESDLALMRTRYREGGLDALEPLAPKGRAHAQATPPAVLARILAIALEHPDWGCVRIAEQLKREDGGAVSSPTVQSLLIKHQLGSKAQRIDALEEAHLATGCPLSPEQESLLVRENPCFRERHAPSPRPAALLVQECFLVGNLPRLGNIYFHAAVDAFNAYAFGFLYPGKRPECAVAVLHNDAIPFYAAHHLEIAEVLTDTGWEYGKSPFQFYLRMNGITHTTTHVRGAAKHGFYERFYEIARGEFCKRVQGAEPYASLEALQADLDAWLLAYNHARPLTGYPNRGRTPSDALNAYLAPV
jgi:transposase InsO family protein